MRVVLVKNLELGGDKALANGTMGRITGWRGVVEARRDMEEGKERAIDALKAAEVARAGGEEAHVEGSYGKGAHGEGALDEGAHEEREREYYDCKRIVEASFRALEWLREQLNEWGVKSLPIVRCRCRYPRSRLPQPWRHPVVSLARCPPSRHPKSTRAQIGSRVWG